MIATAVSRIKRRIYAVISTVNSVCLIDGPLLPSKDNSRCPAIMFAVNRTASVPGRMMLLIVSMMTINDINIDVFPCGTRCSNMWLVFSIHPNSININHIGRARVSVSVRCLVLVKMYGNSPRKFLLKLLGIMKLGWMSFLYFRFLFLKLFLFPGVTYLLVRLLLNCLVMALIRFLLELVEVQ